MRLPLYLLLPMLCLAPVRALGTPPELLTTAEKTDYTATSRYADVVELCDRIAAASGGRAVRQSFGVTEQGRDIPLLILADPPVTSPAQARRTGKPVVLLFGNIHAGEVCGKEALVMLAREWLGLDGEGAPVDTPGSKPAPSSPPEPGPLKDLVLCIVPIYNADGNENIGPIDQKRAGQNGPFAGDGVGTRENAQGLDLNRDYVKLEASETRAMVRFLVEWDPAVVVDTHTTNGSHHRHVMTYSGPTNPAGDPGVLAYVRDQMLPELSRRCLDRYTMPLFQYGNFEKDNTQWTTYPDYPRYGTPYIGLRGRIGLLSEAYSYAPFKDRVLATRDFCREIVRYTAEKKAEILELVRRADERTIEAGKAPKPDDLVALRSDAKAFPSRFTALGYEEEERDGKRTATDRPKEYEVDLIHDFQPTLTTRRPFAYLIERERGRDRIVPMLLRHGVKVEELREDLELDAEALIVESVSKAMRPFQGHDLMDVKTSTAAKRMRARAGMFVVRTAQPLGNLAAYLLEPSSADGLTAWNFFDDALTLGAEFPVIRVVEATPMLTAPTRPLADYRTFNKRIDYAGLDSGEAPNFGGSPLGRLRWLEPAKAGGAPAGEGAPSPDADEYYVQVRDGGAYRVSALTGRSEPLWDLAPMTQALGQIASIGPDAAKSLVGPFMNMSPQRDAAVFTHENDLYYATLSGTAARLTSSPQDEEYPTFSPDGTYIAFIRSNDLWVVDVRTQHERALTTGGTDLVRNGKNDWVYFEELYNRSWRAFWWSPDSKRLAFLQVDSTPVPRFRLPADHAEPRVVEDAPYPEPGEPNPLVKLGVVTAAGGDVRWADLSDYHAGQFLITGVTWPSAPADKQDSRVVWCYVQNRVQTWLDVVSIMVGNGRSTRLMRETTDAWVEPQGEPMVLKDGSFILASERTGFRHLYLFDKAGKLKNPITQGEWEARSIEHVDEDAGYVYYMGTADGSIGQNLYRSRLDGSNMTRLTRPFVSLESSAADASSLSDDERRHVELEVPSPDRGGSHAVSFSPSGRFYIDTWSDHRTPTQVGLFAADGSIVRALDTNPVYSMEEYERGTFGMFTVPTRDGFDLEATVLLPPDFDPAQKYPVWLMTYAGPHAPTVSDTWGGGRVGDEAMASTGLIVFRVDPRSASGKGAKSAWSAYKQLGVQELKDLEDAVAWLAKRPYVDASRVGMSGGSYGGFMTAYALTHSKVFAAGVAVASPTDWRDYDSVYTERYMLMPQDNLDGYEKSSVVAAAKDLHGRLLLVHGTMDDNVHMLNTLKLVRALQAANKPFEFMLYPGSRHGVGAPHYRRLFRDFIQRAFGLSEAGEPEPVARERPRRGRRPRGQ
ncbi:MAG: DPP IV N-terminal domain-containing protein [Phycisphaerales bacterium]